VAAERTDAPLEEGRVLQDPGAAQHRDVVAALFDGFVVVEDGDRERDVDDDRQQRETERGYAPTAGGTWRRGEFLATMELWAAPHARPSFDGRSRRGPSIAMLATFRSVAAVVALASFFAAVVASSSASARPLQLEADVPTSSGQRLFVGIDACPTFIDDEVGVPAVFQSQTHIDAPGASSPSLSVRRIYVVDVSAASSTPMPGFAGDTNGDGVAGTRLDAALSGLFKENHAIARDKNFVGFWCNANGDGYSYSLVAFAGDAAFADLSTGAGVTPAGSAEQLASVLTSLRSVGADAEIGLHTPIELTGAPNLEAALALCLQVFAAEPPSSVYEVVVLGCSDVGADDRWSDELAALQSLYQVRFQCHEVGSATSPWKAVPSGQPSGFFLDSLPGLVLFERHIIRWNGVVKYSWGSLAYGWWEWGLNWFSNHWTQGDTTSDFWGDFDASDWPVGTTLVEVEARATDGTSVKVQKQVLKLGRRLAASANEDQVVVAPPNGWGAGLAIDGSTLLVAGTKEGTAGVLRLDPSNAWKIDSVLLTQVGGATTSSGGPVALDGTRAVLGVPSLATVHVFENSSGSNWSEVAALASAFPTSGSMFGAVVDVSGDVVAVGAPLGSGSSSSDGRVHVFERAAGGTWFEAAVLSDVSGVDGDGFGSSLRVVGDRLFVGAPGRELTGVLGAGVVHVFERSPAGTWQFVSSLTAPTLEPDGMFGAALDVAADTLVIGSPGAGPAAAPYVGAGTTGRVFVFRDTAPNGWTFEQDLVWDDRRPLDSFGARVAVVGARIVALAPGPANRSDANGTPWGHAVAFERALGSTWRHVVTFESSLDHSFKRGLALDATRLVLGSAETYEPLHDFALGRLYHGRPELSVVTGGEQALLLRTDPTSAGDLFLFAGSASGTSVGFFEPFGGLHVGVDPDAYTFFLLDHLGGGLVVPWFGLLDANGDADASFRLPAGTNPSLVGTSVHHAAIVVDLPSFVSKLVTEPVRVEIVN